MALVDDVKITIKAGRGGDGAKAFAHKKPDGGDGGRGGNIYFKATHNVSDLSLFRFQKELKAQNGENGGRKNLSGKNGEDMYILVPLGTKITVEGTGITHELLHHEQTFLVARGGRKGIGNHNYQLDDQDNIHTNYGQGGLGDEKNIHLVVSLIADIGLVGFPNAGKSSLLNELTNAHPKIGAYPFTTLNPNLGVMDGIVLADIPGLIEGASQGSGLGIQFLKHIEKTKLLVHCIDSTTEDVKKAYMTIQGEFEQYSADLLTKHEIIVLTKVDLLKEDEIKMRIDQLKSLNKTILTVSIYDTHSIKEFRKKLESTFQEM